MIGFFQLKKFQIYWISIQGCFLFILQGGGREWKTTKKGRKAERKGRRRKNLKTMTMMKENSRVESERSRRLQSLSWDWGKKSSSFFSAALLDSLFFYFIIFDSRKQPVVAAEHCENESFVFKLRFHPNPLSSSISRKERERETQQQKIRHRSIVGGWVVNARERPPLTRRHFRSLLLWKDI